MAAPAGLKDGACEADCMRECADSAAGIENIAFNATQPNSPAKGANTPHVESNEHSEQAPPNALTEASPQVFKQTQTFMQQKSQTPDQSKSPARKHNHTPTRPPHPPQPRNTPSPARLSKRPHPLHTLHTLSDPHRIYTVAALFRNYAPALSFTIVLYGPPFTVAPVDPSQSTALARGLLYVGDAVRVQSTSPAGILLAPLSDTSPTTSPHRPTPPNTPQPLPATATATATTDTLPDLVRMDATARAALFSTSAPPIFLPFLCDILPFSRTAIPTASLEPLFSNGRFTGTYALTPANQPPLPSPERNTRNTPSPPTTIAKNLTATPTAPFIARITHKTRINTYPNAFNPFFFAIASSANHTVKLVFWRETLKAYGALRPGDVVAVTVFKERKRLPFIDRLEPNTFTESVIFGCEEVAVKELFLIETGVHEITGKGTGVHEITGKGEAGGAAALSEGVPPLFETLAGPVCYLSVVMRMRVGAALMEYLLCRVGAEPVVLFYNSDGQFYDLRPGTAVRITGLRRVERAGQWLYVSSIYTQLTLTGAPGVPGEFAVAESAVFGAVGFVPDTFKSTAEILAHSCTERLQGRLVVVGMLMKPTIVGVEELKEEALVLNETRKRIVRARLEGVARDGPRVEFQRGTGTQVRAAEQRTGRAVLEGGVEALVCGNFFVGGGGEGGEAWEEAEEVLQALERRIGQRLFFVVEAFRADAEQVLYWLTGMMER